MGITSAHINLVFKNKNLPSKIKNGYLLIF